VPARLANLVHDLNRTYSVDDLAKMLPWSAGQLRDSLELLKLPANLQDKLEQQAARDAAEAPIPVTVVLDWQGARTVARSHFATAMAALRA
jgi:hypothetical protein